jgi:hypothetical protein
MPAIAANGLHLATTVATTMCAGLLMVYAGTKKKVLQWKKTPHRCPACGRAHRGGCRLSG